MHTIVDGCGCHASKQSDSRERGLISSLPIPYCANSLLYVDFIHGLPRFGGYDSRLVVTCGLSCRLHVGVLFLGVHIRSPFLLIYD